MILRENGTRFYVEGKVLTIGGRISANGESEYEGLFGTITEIRSGADRETENDVPDIYCDFEIPASEEMLRELEARFSDLYGETKTLDDISLDCVIMSPDMLEPLDTPPGKRLVGSEMCIRDRIWTLRQTSLPRCSKCRTKICAPCALSRYRLLRMKLHGRS